MLLGYARVSKGAEQETRMQETALRVAGVGRLFTARASGGRWDRPELHRLLPLTLRACLRRATHPRAPRS